MVVEKIRSFWFTDFPINYGLFISDLGNFVAGPVDSFLDSSLMVPSSLKVVVVALMILSHWSLE